MKSLKAVSIVILAAVFATAVILICAERNASAAKLSGWTIQLDETSRYHPVEGSYVGTMSDGDCRTIWNIWKKYRHPAGCFDNVSDVYFRLTDDSDGKNYEFFEYDDRDGLIQYCKIVNDRLAKRTYAYLSGEDRAAFFQIIEKYRSELVKWTLEIEAVRGDIKNRETYELSSESIKAFSDMWFKVYRYNPNREGISEGLLKEKTEKDPTALFTVTLHNCRQEEAYFIYHDESLTLEYVTVVYDTLTGDYSEYRRGVVLDSESFTKMWKIIEDYTGVVEHNTLPEGETQ
ncbi:MAG: hypothetical protein J5592_00345 [Clostridia bacterium]|nr:hypothetical protein [Clostridia bacterium]